MSPLVGIAGVLMTFVAFMMQVRANEKQRELLGKSFKQHVTFQDDEGCRQCL